MNTDYTVQVQDIDYCQHSIQYLSNSDKVNSKMEEALSELKKTKISGFRKGKAPDNILKLKFKKEIEDFVISRMTGEAWQDIQYETKLKFIGSPQFAKLSLDKGKFFCELHALSRPKVELKEYKNLSLDKYKSPTTKEAQLEEGLKLLQLKHAELQPFEDNDIVENNDKVTIDLKAISYPTGLEEIFNHEGILYTIGDNLYENLDNELLGMKIGETKMFLSSKEKSKDLRGDDGKIRITVTISMGLKAKPHELNDELAENLQCSSLDDLKEKLSKTIDQKNLKEEKLFYQNQLVNKLLENHTTKMPEWLVDGEAKMLAQKHGMTEITKELKDQAEKNLRLSIILEEVREAEPEACLSDLQMLQSIKKQMADKPELANFVVQLEQQGKIGQWLAENRVNFVLEWIMSTCKIGE